MNDVLLFAAAAPLAVWGLAHLVMTRKVVSGFGLTSDDDRRVVTMEWVVEGLAVVFLATLITTVALADLDSTGRAVLWLVVGMLNVMSAVSLATGFRVDFIAYRLCPVIFSGASLLVIAGLLA
jgi:hypothetical protein